MERVLLAMIMLFATMTLPAQITLKDITKTPPEKAYKYRRTETITDAKFGSAEKKALAWSMLSYSRLYRNEHLPDANARLEKTETKGLRLTMPLAFTEDHLAEVLLNIEAAKGGKGVDVSFEISASHELDDSGVESFWKETILVEMLAPSFTETPAREKAYDRIGPVWTTSELLVAAAKAGREPVLKMNQEEVLKVFGAPSERQRMAGKSFWTYNFEGAHGIPTIMSVFFDDSGLVEDFSKI